MVFKRQKSRSGELVYLVYLVYTGHTLAECFGDKITADNKAGSPLNTLLHFDHIAWI